MKQIITTLILVAVTLFTSCSKEESTDPVMPPTEQGNTFTLTYVIPDPSVPTSRAIDYVEAVGEESTVSGLHLLFFESDAHGNGSFVAWQTATLQNNHLSQNTVTLTLPAGVAADKEYQVLVVANLSKFYTAADLTTYLNSFKDKTYGKAWSELQAPLSTADGIYTFLNKQIPMSGTTVKHANQPELTVDLLRATVRIDAKVAASGVSLTEVQLYNIVPIVPLFRTQEESTLSRVCSERLTVMGNLLRGGLYAIETSLDVSDPRALLSQATCLLVNVKSDAIHKDADIDKTWYRVNLNVDGNGMQYLKRNNAYTVVIKGVYTPGSSTPDEAYHNEETLVSSITITGWKASGVTPPDVDIN